jgi:hypothetical protein
MIHLIGLTVEGGLMRGGIAVRGSCSPTSDSEARVRRDHPCGRSGLRQLTLGSLTTVQQEPGVPLQHDQRWQTRSTAGTLAQAPPTHQAAVRRDPGEGAWPAPWRSQKRLKGACTCPWRKSEGGGAATGA